LPGIRKNTTLHSLLWEPPASRRVAKRLQAP
jgi:hypothetical protein